MGCEIYLAAMDSEELLKVLQIKLFEFKIRPGGL